MMMPTTRRRDGMTDRSLLAPIAAALAIKAVALMVLYFAFFVPPPAPTASHAAAAVLGLSAER
ncbi:MAG TPA: hypothetical protein VMI30_06635 [Stellaceae bacterium]|nr:hypothetical protein [Stellaceae bacterium]